MNAFLNMNPEGTESHLINLSSNLIIFLLFYRAFSSRGSNRAEFFCRRTNLCTRVAVPHTFLPDQKRISYLKRIYSKFKEYIKVFVLLGGTITENY